MKRFSCPLALLLASLLLVSVTAGIALSSEDGFQPVTGPCRLAFPADHGPHADYRTEWWYYTGNLSDAKGRRFGFQLTFFRVGLQAPHGRRDWPQPPSAWRSDQMYLAHAALSDIDNGRHRKAETMARPVLSLAGTEQRDGAVTIGVHDWQAVIRPAGHRLVAETDHFAIRLDLQTIKPPVMHGDAGYHRKGQEPGRASCYYSFTRLAATGTLTVEGLHHDVRGSAWMDHEFGTAPLQPGITGWDWFSLQLSDGTEVMLYLLRQADGTRNAASGGTFVPASGAPHHLASDDVTVEPRDYWTSPRSGGRYPIQWRLRIPSLGLDLLLSADLKDQEMDTLDTTGVIYWEGSVNAAGTRDGEPLEGVGYVELTGYAAPFDAPM